MELAHSLLLNESALERIADNKKPVFIFEWLRFLDKVLIAAHKSDIKEKQERLVQQLIQQLHNSPGPPTRKLLARTLSTLYSVGDTITLFTTINTCNDLIKSRDDSPSSLSTRLAAIACLGGMYERLGRMVGRSFEETVAALVKLVKVSESQARCEVMLTLEQVVEGLGSAGGSSYREIFKAARTCMTDRSMVVRSAAARCMLALVKHSPPGQPADLETTVSLCLRALDGSNYDVRCDVAKLLGFLLAKTQTPVGTGPTSNQSSKQKRVSLDEVFGFLSSGFLKGGGGFLKGTSSATDMIRGSGGVIREVRVGVTHAYVEFAKCMGGKWLERNLAVFLHHVLYLVASPRACPTHVDAVYARKCVQFVLRTVCRSALSEKAQTAAARELCNVVVRCAAAGATGGLASALPSAFGGSGASEDANAENQHVIVCALLELGHLLHALDTAAAPLLDPPTSAVDSILAVLLHPASAARLAAAYALRSLAVALPNQLTPLLDNCMQKLNALKASPEAVSGYSYALAALLAGVRQGELGIPHAKGKQVFNLAEELLRSANQNSRLTLPRTQAGWFLLGAVMTLGGPAVKPHLPRMVLLWKNAFPRSSKELDAERTRGDAFSWQVTLEARAGALCAMQSFLEHCGPELVTDDVIRRLLPPIECALAMLAQMPQVIRSHGNSLKAGAAMVRLRLYSVLLLLPTQSYTGAYNSLLRELVAEFTLTENPSNTTTSLLRSLCHVDDSVILGSWLQETDHKAIEDQLQPNSASGSGALEHDAASLFLKQTHNTMDEGGYPGPLPLGVAVIDTSVQLFGAVFPRVQHRHRLQMLEHFAECIRTAKSTRQQAVQINIFTAYLCAMKQLSVSKTPFGGEHDLRKAAVALIFGALGSSNPILRCAAGECLGRMAQVIGEARFIAEMAQYSFDKLRTVRGVVDRTGHSLALGCLHRYTGSLSSGQHLNTSVGILLALAQDTSSPVVQVWALHALALIADSGGPMFRDFVEPTLSLVLQLLLQIPPSLTDVHQCLGKVLGALITTVGPELQGNTGSVATARLSCLVCCAVMQDHPDSLVQAEAISCLQQLHMFAPRHVNLGTLVPHLCVCLSSRHLLLRRAAVSCLRQLAQKEAAEVCELAMTLVTESSAPTTAYSQMQRVGGSDGSLLPQTGVEGALFSLLDTETDPQMRKDVQDTLLSLLQSQGRALLVRWLALLKDVLQAGRPGEGEGEINPEMGAEPGGDDDEDDDVTFRANKEDENTHPQVTPRWPTRVFAIDCLRRIMTACEQSGEPQHFDLTLSREVRASTGRTDCLVLHLSELVRMAFMAATSDSDRLRLAGLAAMQDLIQKFAKSPEPEFPGHVILEQYQAQVGAALRPAFAKDTASDVTAAACEVCSAWIGSGVARDLNDLRRVHQLLVSSLGKLRLGRNQAHIYSESASTMEKLAVLRAWGEVYIIAMTRRNEEMGSRRSQVAEEEEDFESTGSGSSGEDLLSLVRPEMSHLTQHWLSALRDHALLGLPAELASQLPPEGGAFYSAECADNSRDHYRRNWSALVHAASLWLDAEGFQQVPANRNAETINTERFMLIIGICVEAMCNLVSKQPLEVICVCLTSVDTLLEKQWPRSALTKEEKLPVEMLNVIHRVFLTRDCIETHLLCVRVMEKVVIACREKLETNKQNALEAGIQNSPTTVIDEAAMDQLGEGGGDEVKGRLVPGQSAAFAALEVVLCGLTRYLPQLPGPAAGGPIQTLANAVLPPAQSRTDPRAAWVIAALVRQLGPLLDLCAPAGAVAILPSILHLCVRTTQVFLFESAITPDSRECSQVSESVAEVLSVVGKHRFHSNNAPEWHRLLASALMDLLKHPHPVVETGTQASTTVGPCCMQALSLVSRVLSDSPSALLRWTDLRSALVDLATCAWTQLADRPSQRRDVVRAIDCLVQHPDSPASAFCIRRLAPLVYRWLYTLPVARCQDDVLLIQAAVGLLENLVDLAETAHRAGMLLLLVPLLISMLPSGPEMSTTTRFQRDIQEYALARVTAVGPAYPNEFRTILGSLGDLKLRLETAVKASQVKRSAADAASKSAAAALSQLSQVKPTIQLKMDFSNFK